MSSYVNFAVEATWDEYEQLLEIRGDRREPQLCFDTNKLGIEGFPEAWDEPVKLFIQELLENEEDLHDAIAAEEDGENEHRISWEEVKRGLTAVS